MTEFSSGNYCASGYSLARPHYPSEFFDYLKKYHRGKSSFLVDVGCGPGKFTIELANALKFVRIKGTDVSPNMIGQAKRELEIQSIENVQFDVCPAEDMSWSDPNSVDMITAAQCSHWFDFKKFLESAHRVLRPGGTLAFWGYVDPVFVDYPELDSVIEEFQYADSSLGPYWEQPGRQLLRELLKDQVIDGQYFTDIQETLYRPRMPIQATGEVNSLRVDKQMSLLDFELYIKTWSSYNAWRAHNPKKQDICKKFMRRVSGHTRQDPNTPLKVAWSTVNKLARRR